MDNNGLALPSAALAPSGLSPEDGSQAEQPATNAFEARAERQRADSNWARADYLAGLLDQHGIAYEWGESERKAPKREGAMRETQILRQIVAAVAQYRNAPFRSADWLASELMAILDCPAARTALELDA